MPPDPVGAIGLGLLGTAIAERLTTSGVAVHGFDAEPAALQRLEALGGRCMASVSDVLRCCNTLLLCLPNSDVVAAVLTEHEDQLREGMLVLDCTTGEPESAEQLGERLSRRGIDYVDATVGGSSEQVRRGEVIVMAGGSNDAFRRAERVLDTFAHAVFHLGSWGSGARMKLVLNMVLGLHRAVLAEALGFARALGVDPARALEILAASPAYSTVMDVKGEKMLKRDYTPQARVSQHLKDVRLMLSAGARSGARLPLTKLHEALLQELVDSGFADSDNSAIYEAFLSPCSTPAEEHR